MLARNQIKNMSTEKAVSGYLESGRVQRFLGGLGEVKIFAPPPPPLPQFSPPPPPPLPAIFSRPKIDLFGDVNKKNAPLVLKNQPAGKNIPLPLPKNRAPIISKEFLKKEATNVDIRATARKFMLLWIENSVLKKFKVFPFSPPQRPDALQYLKIEIEKIQKDDNESITRMLIALKVNAEYETAMELYNGNYGNRRTRSEKLTLEQPVAKRFMTDAIKNISSEDAEIIIKNLYSSPRSEYQIQMESFDHSMTLFYKDSGDAYELKHKPGNDASDDEKLKYLEIYIRNLPPDLKTLICKERQKTSDVWTEVETNPSSMSGTIGITGKPFRLEEMTDTEMDDFSTDLKIREKLMQGVSILRPLLGYSMKDMIENYENNERTTVMVEEFLLKVRENITFVNELKEKKNEVVLAFRDLAQFMPDDKTSRKINPTLFSRAAKNAASVQKVELDFGLSLMSNVLFQNEHEASFLFLKAMSSTKVTEIQDVPVFSVLYYKTVFPIELGKILSEKINSSKELFENYKTSSASLVNSLKEGISLSMSGSSEFRLDFTTLLDIFKQFKSVKISNVPDKIYNMKKAIVLDVEKYYAYKPKKLSEKSVQKDETICVDPLNKDIKAKLDNQAIKITDEPCLESNSSDV